MKQQKILLVEDDLDLVAAFRPVLKESGWEVVHVAAGLEALPLVVSHNFDAIILDVGLPDIDGFALCEELRAIPIESPILFLTSRSEEMDRVTGFAVGADDYVLKPFSVRELVFRLKAIFRRRDSALGPLAKDGREEKISIGELKIEPRQRRVYLRNEELQLSALEFDILLFFMKKPGEVFSRDDLMTQIWSVNNQNFGATITTQIGRLRKKIEPDPTNPTYLQTVYGIGYRFLDPERDTLAASGKPSDEPAS